MNKSKWCYTRVKWNSSWKGKVLPWGGKLILVNSVLSTLHSYFMSIYKLPKWVIKRIDMLWRAFLWKGSNRVNGFNCLVNWDSVYKFKEQGGLGVNDLAQMNHALLIEWTWKFLHRGNRHRRNQIYRTYYSKKRLGIRVRKTTIEISPIWRDINVRKKAL